MSKDDSSRKWAFGALLAGLIGYIAGILTAPKSGQETRADIKETAEKDIAAIEKQLKKARADLEKAVAAAKVEVEKLKGQARNELDGALAKAEMAAAKAHEILAAVKAGDADDRDLQEALNDVNKAYEHLKEYLKKS